MNNKLLRLDIRSDEDYMTYHNFIIYNLYKYDIKEGNVTSIYMLRDIMGNFNGHNTDHITIVKYDTSLYIHIYSMDDFRTLAVRIDKDEKSTMNIMFECADYYDTLTSDSSILKDAMNTMDKDIIHDINIDLLLSLNDLFDSKINPVSPYKLKFSLVSQKEADKQVRIAEMNSILRRDDRI